MIIPKTSIDAEIQLSVDYLLSFSARRFIHVSLSAKRDGKNEDSLETLICNEDPVGGLYAGNAPITAAASLKKSSVRMV